MPSEVKNKYLNWLSLIETDYITMFIKTWFTFLATLHEISPSSGRRIGDGEIIKNYKERLFDDISIKINNAFIKNVFDVYSFARDNVLKNDRFLEYYYKVFFEINDSFSKYFIYTYYRKKLYSLFKYSTITIIIIL